MNVLAKEPTTKLDWLILLIADTGKTDDATVKAAIKSFELSNKPEEGREQITRILNHTKSLRPELYAAWEDEIAAIFEP